jgi:hypothetical protein
MNRRQALRHIYAPPKGKGDWRLEDLVGHPGIRYFSLGRHALLHGLVAAGVGRGDRVLLPAMVCRDLLAPLNALGVEPAYYQVTKRLEPALDANLPAAKAIVAIDYFGFPQDLTGFLHYCQRTGAILVEDNAQGFLSRDREGCFLGTRGDIGIISLRKTLPVQDGALLLGGSKIAAHLPTQVPFEGSAPLSFLLKQAARRLAPLTGVVPLVYATKATRLFRRLRTGNEIEPSGMEGEQRMAEREAPSVKLFSRLYALDIGHEARRRRELYLFVLGLLKGSPCEPLFDGLPDWVVPYGFPFYARPGDTPIVKKRLGEYMLECFPWPELPRTVEPVALDHYRNLWIVRFLW